MLSRCVRETRVSYPSKKNACAHVGSWYNGRQQFLRVNRVYICIQSGSFNSDNARHSRPMPIDSRKKKKKKIKAPAGKDDYDTARLTAIVHRNVVGTEPSGRLCSRLENRINSRCTYPSGVDIVPCTLFPVPCCAGR